MTPSTNELLSWLDLYERDTQLCPACDKRRPDHYPGCPLVMVLREVGYMSRQPRKPEPRTGDEGETDRLVYYFNYAHLPPALQEISKPFYEAASRIGSAIEDGDMTRNEANVALRKLLEAKDCAVRAAL